MTFIKYSRYISGLKADSKLGSYANRRGRSIIKMHNLINDDPAYSTGIPEEKLMVKKYWPSNRRDVSPVYSRLIYLISTYFNCYSVWVYKVIPGTNEPVKSVWHFGYKEEVMLTAKYVANEINNLELLKFSRQQKYRKTKKRSRRKNYNVTTADARTKAINFRNAYLEQIEEHWAKALDNKILNPLAIKKYETISEYITQHLELEYKKFKYKGKPVFSGAFCRKGHYKKNQVIRG